jgi:hypothetical protein
LLGSRGASPSCGGFIFAVVSNQPLLIHLSIIVSAAAIITIIAIIAVITIIAILPAVLLALINVLELKCSRPTEELQALSITNTAMRRL